MSRDGISRKVKFEQKLEGNRRAEKRRLFQKREQQVQMCQGRNVSGGVKEHQKTRVSGAELIKGKKARDYIRREQIHYMAPGSRWNGHNCFPL